MVGEGGIEFETEIAAELGLRKVPGSGNKWFARLDLRGRMARWSLKYTSKKSFKVDHALIDEAVEICQGPGGDGAIPVWLIRLQNPKYDIVLIRKEDFKLIQQEEIKLIERGSNIKSEQKKVRASIPQLLRDK